MPTTLARPTRFEARQTWLFLAGLALLTFAIYGQVFRHEFLTLDDADAITANPIVQDGLSARGTHWAFTNFANGTWQPLTWLSWMLDCQIFGLHPGWHHLSNVFYHLLNIFLLFFCLREMTGSVEKSAAAAFLFAAHPLRVESVAWAVERKDTLSALFWLLSVLAYIYYNRKKTPALMALTAAFFAMGCMSKPMVVTLPLALMALDMWPLQRSESWKNRILEKWPLWIISMAAALITCIGANSSRALNAEYFPASARLGNAMVSYTLYLYKTFLPIHLSVFYPFPPGGWQIPGVLGAALFLILTTCAAFHAREKQPFLLSGWLWFLTTLLPVIGLVQMGSQTIADRFTYIPHMGLLTGLAWALFDKKAGRTLLFSAIAIFAFLSWRQTGFWKNSMTLHEHDLKVTRKNFMAHTNLGLYYEQKGDFENAALHYGKSLEIRPRNPGVLNNLGNALVQMGKLEEAEKIYSMIEAKVPGYTDALVNLGIVYLEKKEWERSRLYFQRATSQDASRVKAWLGLAQIEMVWGNTVEAENFLEKALLLAPDDEETNNLAAIFKRRPEN